MHVCIFIWPTNYHTFTLIIFILVLFIMLVVFCQGLDLISLPRTHTHTHTHTQTYTRARTHAYHCHYILPQIQPIKHKHYINKCSLYITNVVLACCPHVWRHVVLIIRAKCHRVVLTAVITKSGQFVLYPLTIVLWCCLHNCPDRILIFVVLSVLFASSHRVLPWVVVLVHCPLLSYRVRVTIISNLSAKVVPLSSPWSFALSAKMVLAIFQSVLEHR